MMIELVGLPGVGKSTLARMLEGHGFIKVRVEGKVDLLFSNVRYFVKYPVAFIKLFFAVIQTSVAHGRFYPLLMNVFLDTNARILKAKLSKNRSIVDQGNLQGLLSLSYHLLTEKEVEDFLKYLPRPDQVVFLSAPEETRQKRLHQRGYGPREGEKNRETWLRYLTENMETLEDSVVAITWAPVLHISTENETQEVVERVLTSIPSPV